MIKIIYIKKSYKDLVEDSELFIHGNFFKVIEIKTGGMGKVVFCKKENAVIGEDYFLPEYVALKAVHEKLSDKPELRSSFKRELINWSQIDYKGFTKLIGIGILPNNDGYVAITDLYDGNLRNLIRKEQCRQHKNKRYSKSINYSNLEKHLSLQDRLIIIYSITSSIYDLYNKTRLMHLDLKPENILFNYKQKLSYQINYQYYELSFFITDLGLSQFKDITRTESIKAMITMEEQQNTLNFFGTPLYMSPERFKKNYKPSQAADVFAIGLILYELIFLEPYFSDLKEVMSHNNVNCKERIEYDLNNSACCLNSAEKTLLSPLLLEMLYKDPLERLSLRLLPNRLQSICHDHKTVIFKVKKELGNKTDYNQLYYNKAELNNAIDIFVEHKASNSFKLNLDIKKEKDSARKMLNQIIEDELLGEKETMQKGEVLKIIPFRYKLRIYQFGLLNYLTTNETKALSMFRTHLNSNNDDEDEQIGNIEFFKKTCLRIKKLIYALNGSDKIDFSKDYILKILSEDFIVNDLQKDLIKYKQCPMIYNMSEITSIMIKNLCAGGCADLETPIGQWVTRDNFISYIIHKENLKEVKYLAGVVFRFNAHLVEIRKIFFEQIIKHRYQVLINIKEYQMIYSENRLNQIDEETNEKHDIVTEEPFTHYRVLDPRLIKKEVNQEVRKIFQKIYAG